MKSPIYIVGGGIIGLLSARELAMAGETVAVLDRRELGRESSWAGGGILSPLYPWRYPEPVNRLAHWGQTAYPDLARELLASTQLDVEWIRSGLLILDTAEAGRALAWAGQAGVPLSQLDDRSLHARAPAVSPAIASALHLPEVAQVRNPRLVMALHQDLAGRGVELRERVEVHGFESRHGRLQALHTSAGVLPTERAIVAAGAWSAALLADTGLDLDHPPVKGQMLLLRPRPRLISTVLLNDGYYLIPRRDGHILVGSTQERTGFDKATSTAAREELRAAARTMVPALADAAVEKHWAGLRPSSPRGIPIIDRHPDIQGLHICTGHFRNGLVMAPASARLMADLLLDRPPIVDPAPYRLPKGG
ncbi:MAG: glycine oxidase ThiO [Candidatus Muproteobacteria bacterium RBG_16_64_11]|uniref:Glycine oxidase ThiO n=1 Tax=Candidatus Muproteobacteria bacterium RBG_16_64_11 TaxID=1817758 RepID=A0A1F6TA73_9PROT|nr:MAG: glycine oxidase ThiO [Candidatus Muproteobacteria bacterium RBG_16_64_11]